jgi:hypothetical protein
MEIKNNVDSGYKGKLIDFNELQPINLKIPMYSEITKKSIISRGFVQPFAMCKIDDKLYIIDGHLRHDLINELINDGYKVPNEFSYYLIDVKNDFEIAIDTLMSFNVKVNPIDLPALNEWVKIQQISVNIEELNVKIEEVQEYLNDSEDFGTDFILPDGDKAPFQQMTFTLADEQAEQIKNAINDIKQTDEYKYAETMGNENSNGNALYLIIMQWAEQRK